MTYLYPRHIRGIAKSQNGINYFLGSPKEIRGLGAEEKGVHWTVLNHIRPALLRTLLCQPKAI